MAFAGDTPAPATIVVITGDGDFIYAISTLRLRRYRIILLAPQNSKPALKSQATAFYAWPQDVLSGELPVPGLPPPPTSSRPSISSTGHPALRPYTPRFADRLPPGPGWLPWRHTSSVQGHAKAEPTSGVAPWKQCSIVRDRCSCDTIIALTMAFHLRNQGHSLLARPPYVCRYLSFG